MYLINQLGFLEVWNLKYYVIFFCFIFTKKVTLVIVENYYSSNSVEQFVM